MELSNALLKLDPFLIEAPTDALSAVWADMEGILTRSRDIIRDALSSGITQVVLNRGRWGAGKTHSAIYFSYQERVKAEASFTGSVECIYIRTPMQAEQAVEEFFTNTIEAFNWNAIRGWMQNINTALGDDNAFKWFNTTVKDADLARIMLLMGKPEYNDYHLRRYLIGTPRPTSRELSDLRLAKVIRSGQRASVLAAILRSLIYSGSDQAEGRIFIWIDETENLNFYPPTRRRAITEMWRDLVDAVPRGLTVFLNYTPAGAERGEALGQVYGSALLSRISQIVTFEPLSEDDSFKYIIALLNHPRYRREGALKKGLPVTYPFENNAVSYLISNVKNKTPRNLNLVFGEVLRSALRDNTISLRGIINTSYVEQKWPEIAVLMAREEELEE